MNRKCKKTVQKFNDGKVLFLLSVENNFQYYNEKFNKRKNLFLIDG